MCRQPFFSRETEENTQSKKHFRFYLNLQLTGNMKIEGSLVERNHYMREFPCLRKGRRRENRRIKSMEITEEDLDKLISGQDPVKDNSKGRRKSSREPAVP